MNIAIIPARGGSKGILNKNLQLINGESLIKIAVLKLGSLPFIDEVYVSTDSRKIAHEGSLYGAKIHMRREEISRDTSTSEEAIIDFLESLGSGEDDNILFHQCTSPLLKTDSIKSLWDYYLSSDADCVFTVSKESNPIWKLENDGKAERILYESNPRRPRQLREPLYIETGGAYAFSSSRFLRDKNRFGKDNKFIEVSKVEAIDIDSIEDLFLANKLI